MILTCPECATSYFVDDLRIPRGGRMVKCTSCGNRWRAFQDRAEPEHPPLEDEMLVEAPRDPTTPAPGDDVEFMAAPAAPIRKPEPKKKKASVAMVVGVGLAAGLALALGGAVIFRQPLSEKIPATAPLFAAIGLPVNTLGLVIEGVKQQATFQAGRPVLSVTGAIRNVRKDSIEAPPIRISLVDKAGKPVAGVLAQPLNAKVPPGATRYFAVTLADPPAGAHALDIAFEEPAKGGAPHAEPAAAAHAEPAPAAAAPVEAQPLPANSPDALTKHE
ncbi:MAG: DUF3426 domain-containing protein [Phenylobacterium sp.]|uniref:DUF3426 domain-containing protein n=1 Tax=Phenylobacterium sp. TaxID=1871053 RepID=UPI001215D6C4|nr:DUF3426 domain-containing protein [Phenylobacterium sp.]TAJ71026.1 MAG: DUF3426 domain-containing protein [Phenylobacterium sp.]